MTSYMVFHALIAVFIVSLLSLLGALFLLLKKPWVTRIMSALLAFSSGVLLGSAFFDLLPESMELLPEYGLMYVVAGIVVFFSLEKLMRWHHHTDGDHGHENKTPGYLTLIGDGVHNFIDGVIIGSAFLISIPLGISATLAVIAHEIPHELADFTILLHSGFSNTKALVYNFLSAATAIVGTVLIFIVSSFTQTIVPYLIAFAAGNFLYIAMSDLIPELHRPNSKRGSFIQIILLIVGVAVVYFLPSE